MKKTYVCIISLLGLHFNLQAQVNIKAPNTDAISVFNFTESPVSLHTGLVNVTYPIYEIKTNALTIPITLNYFSRGVRVDDIASSVGLGWSLNYGGMVSREIREAADEENNYSYLYNNIYNNFFANNDKRIQVLGTMNGLAGTEYQVDFTPDQFYFSIADYSGKFILDRNDKKPVQQIFSDIKIEPDWSGGAILHSWVITDTKGNKYYYGRNTETNHDYVSYVLTTDYKQKHPFFTYTPLDLPTKQNPDTWYLQKIVTSSNEIIKYNYVYNTTRYYKKNYDHQIAPCLHPCDNPPDVGTIYTYFSDVNENKYALESIEFPEGRLQFVLSETDRKDVLQGNALEKIVLYDKYNKVIESHQLNYTYTDAIINNARTNVLLTNFDAGSKKRMFLKEIKKETVENNSTILIKKTKYNYDPQQLPDRFSTSKDLWGYYNNKSNGTFDHFYDYQGIITNRNVDETYSKAGILTSIDMPTGEKRVFKYENNILLSPYFNYNKIIGFPNTDGSGNKYGPGQRIKAIEYYDGQELKLKKTYEYLNSSGKNSGLLFGMREYMAILGYKSFMPGAAPIPIIDPDGVLAGNINSALESRDFGYSYVKEYFGDQSSNRGKIEYTFTNHPDTWNFAEYPFHWANDNSWTRGLLLKQQYYENKNNTYVLTKDIKNTYKIGGYDFDDITALVGPMPGFAFASPPPFNYEKTSYFYKMPLAKIYLDKRVNAGLAQPNLSSPYLVSANNNVQMYWYYKPYTFTGGRIEKQETIATDYLNNTQIISHTNYTYPSHSNNISKVRITDSDGTIIDTEYSYAYDKNHQLMINKNMVGIPLETVTSKTTGNVTKTISKVETVYPPAIPTSQTGNLVLPLSVRSFNIQNPTDSNSATTDITYDKYDTKGNLQQYTTKDGTSTVIIWGYNQTQPIAKIENAKLADIGQSFITAIVNASNTDAAAGANNDETNLLNAFNTFRGQLSGYKITTYSYDPLIGVRSITPPSGIREVYVYDSANRLKEIREQSQSGNLLKEFKYNYKQ